MEIAIITLLVASVIRIKRQFFVNDKSVVLFQY